MDGASSVSGCMFIAVFSLCVRYMRSCRCQSLEIGLVGETLGEPNEICREARRLLPVDRVPGAAVGLQARADDRRQESLLVALRDEGILVPPDQQGRRRDAIQSRHVLVVPETGEQVAPNPRRGLQALGDEGLEELGGDRASQGALLKLPG